MKKNLVAVVAATIVAGLLVSRLTRGNDQMGG
jgi:hypothetical protein